MGKYPLKQSIVLIGFRGSGKSTVATLLSKMLHLPIVQTDALIEDSVGQSISDFVAANGWEIFRKIEHDIIAGIPLDQATIIDCGGGVVESAQNMRHLTQNTFVVWVDCAPELILRRLAAARNRPLLSEGDLPTDILKNYYRRYPLYLQYAHLRVDTTHTLPLDIANRICEALHTNSPNDTHTTSEK